MNVRFLATAGVFALILLFIPETATPQAKPPDASSKAPDGSSKGSGNSSAAPDGPGSEDFETRVLATIMDSEHKEESKDPAKWAKEPGLLEDVRLFRASKKTPLSRYRLAYPYEPKKFPPPQGYYGIDVYANDDAKLSPMEGGSGETAWKKPERQSEEKVFTGDLQDVEVWSRIVAGQTEIFARCAREHVSLEILVRNKDKEAANKEVRERFKLFYENGVANRLWGEDDDYWKWFVSFGKLCRQNSDEIGCIMATLGVKAEERRRLLGRWQELMQMENEAWPPDEGLAYEWAVLMKYTHDQAVREELGDFTHHDPPQTPITPTLNLAKMKAARDKVATPYKALYAEQAELMTEAQQNMQAIVTSIEQKWKVAQKNTKFATEAEKKHLETSYGYWRDQQALLKMRLYDAAGWHRPEEYAKLVEDLQLTSEAEAEIARLMKAKLLLGTIGDLERRLWLHRISPAYAPVHGLGRLDGRGTTLVSLRRSDPFRALLEPLTMETATPVVFLNVPKGFRAQYDPMELEIQKTHLQVVAALHDFLKDYPKNQEARQMLAKQEFKILNWIAGKMDRERGASWAAFQKFFTNRGYNAESMPHDGWETAWVIWSNPWSTAGHAIAGTPEGLADAVSVDEETAAANLVALNVLRRLSSRGLLLSEIRQLKADDFAKHMILELKDKDGKVTRKPMLPKHINALRTDLDVAFKDSSGPQLGLTELASGDADGFLNKFDKTYFDVCDPSVSIAEGFAEYCLSPQALLFTVGPQLTPMLRLPAAANKWGFVATVGEEYKTIEQLASGGLKLTGLSERLKDTTLAGWIAKDMEFVHGLSTAEWLVRVGGARTAAACGLYMGLVELTEEYDLPRTRLLVHCLFELQAANVAYDILGAARAPAGPVKQMVAQFKKEVSGESEKLETSLGTKTKAGTLQEADDLLKELAEAANENERARIRGKFATLPMVKEGKEIAKNVEKTIKPLGTNSAADRRWATKCYSEALTRGDVAEMKKISQATRTVSERTQKELNQYLEESTVAAKMLDDVSTVTSPVRSTEIKTLAEEAEKTGEVPSFFQTEDVYKKPGGEAMLAADQTMRDGEFATAEMAYGKGGKRAEELGEEELAKLQKRRRAEASVARSTEEMKLAARKAAAKAPELPKLLESFTKEEIQALKDKPEFVKSITPEIFVLKVGDKKYVFKIFNPDAAGIKFKGVDVRGNPVPRTEQEARAEFAKTILEGCTASDFARDLTVAAKEAGKDLAVPATAVQRIDLDFTTNTGRVVNETGVLTRYFEGSELKDLSFPEALAYKKELAIGRVFSALVGDPDRHAGNILVNPRTGEILLIDLENAHFADNLGHRLMGSRLSPGEEDDFVKALLDFVNVAARPRRDGTVSKIYGPAARIDEMLVFEDMHEFIELIEKRYGGAEGKAKLEEIIKRGYKLNGIENVAADVVTVKATVMQERISHLYSKVKGKFQKVQPRTSWLAPRHDDGRALCWVGEPVRLAAA